MTYTKTVSDGSEYCILIYPDPMGSARLESMSLDGWELVTIIERRRDSGPDFMHYFRKPRVKQITVYEKE